MTLNLIFSIFDEIDEIDNEFQNDRDENDNHVRRGEHYTVGIAERNRVIQEYY